MESGQPAAILHALSQGLAMLDLGRAVLLQTDGLDGNEATGVLRAEALESIHASLLLTVQVAVGGRAGKDVSCSLVHHHVDCAIHVLLAVDDGVFEELTLGGEVHA